MKVVILAAGKGTRMGLTVPKVLAPLAGKKLIDFPLESVQSSRIDPRPLIVIGHQAELVEKHVKDRRVDCVLQKEQKGTGHAVAICESVLDPNEDVMVLYGDHALLAPETIHALAQARSRQESPIAMVTYLVPDFDLYDGLFQHYGRILRDPSGKMIAIREAKDASQKELQTHEINPGYYAFSGPWLWEQIKTLEPNNAQGEYYLTDLIQRAIEQGYSITPVQGNDLSEAIGVNTPEQLATVEALLQQRLSRP